MPASKRLAPVIASLSVMLVLACTTLGGNAVAQRADKPYDEALLRLSEILGSMHYLRELCGADEGQLWRERMQELINAEGTSAYRRAMLVRRFNAGYRSYRRTYRSCTPSARTAINRFADEAVKISDGLIAENK